MKRCNYDNIRIMKKNPSVGTLRIMKRAANLGAIRIMKKNPVNYDCIYQIQASLK